MEQPILYFGGILAFAFVKAGTGESSSNNAIVYFVGVVIFALAVLVARHRYVLTAEAGNVGFVKLAPGEKELAKPHVPDSELDP